MKYSYKKTCKHIYDKKSYVDKSDAIVLRAKWYFFVLMTSGDFEICLLVLVKWVLFGKLLKHRRVRERI